MSALSILICFGIPLAVFGGALLYDRFEGFVAAKLAEDALSDWTDPDGGLAAAGHTESLVHHARENGL